MGDKKGVLPLYPLYPSPLTEATVSTRLWTWCARTTASSTLRSQARWGGWWAGPGPTGCSTTGSNSSTLVSTSTTRPALPINLSLWSSTKRAVVEISSWGSAQAHSCLQKTIFSSHLLYRILPRQFLQNSATLYS